jgi:hypothetical protein
MQQDETCLHTGRWGFKEIWVKSQDFIENLPNVGKNVLFFYFHQYL